MEFTPLHIISLAYLVLGLLLAYLVQGRSWQLQLVALGSFASMVAAFIFGYTVLCTC